MPGLMFTHHYAGRSESEGFFLKMLGVRPGIGDILNWWAPKDRAAHPGMICAAMMELKVEDRPQSPEQRKVQAECEHMGLRYRVARTPDDVYAIYRLWGLAPRHCTILAPDYRSFDEKGDDAFEYFMPIRLTPNQTRD